MTRKCLGLRLSLIAVVCSLPVAGFAQQTAAVGASTITTTTTVVPRLVNYSGTLADLNGKPLTGAVGVTFYLYKDSQGGAPLWVETQNVPANKSGHYSVMLGSTSQGLPEDVFVSGEARWLGVQISGQAEQPRVLLVAVPYALKARDAETIGGLPPSAFMLAPVSSNRPAAASAQGEPGALTTNGAVTGAGTVNQIPLWDGASDIVNSVLTQSGSGSTARIGINSTSPTATLEVKGSGTFRGTLGVPAISPATAATGKNSYPFLLTASAFNSGTGTSVNQNFRLVAEPVGNNTSSTSGTLNLLYSTGSNSGAETGLKIASNGQVTFAAGQTFPGVGSVTSVGSGSGLTGGPITGVGSLSIASGGVTNAMLLNPSLTITAASPLSGGGSVPLGGSTTLGLINCTVSGQILKWDRAWGCSTDLNSGGTVTSLATGTGLLGGPITTTGTISVNPAVVPELGLSNTFTNFQTITAGGRGVPLSINNTTTSTADLYLSGGYYGLVASNQVFPINVSTNVGPEAIYAQNDGSSLHNSGIFGGEFGTSGTVYGVFGVNENSANGAGVYGQASVANSSVGAEWPYTGAGVWGDAGSTTTAYAAVLGTADNQSAGAFFNSGTGYFTLYADAGNAFGYPFGAYNAANGNVGCAIDPEGTFSCTGPKSSVVSIDGGQRKIGLSAIESPKNWFEDFGSEHLSNGVTVIRIEPQFAQTVNTALEYHVFLTPNGDCKGLYVAAKTATSFEVRELGGGTSSVAFDYRIVALRKNYENIRMADHTNDPDPSKMPKLSTHGRPNSVDVNRMVPPGRGNAGKSLAQNVQ